MKKPNLFILGAPKCGTTSISEWLGTHPQIFMCKRKEPHYYNKDHNYNSMLNYNHYLSLFKNAKDEHKIIAEASVWYLYSEVATKNILNDSNKDVRFIVLLRNPVQMAYSLHEQQVFNLNEPEKDFKKAWDLQDKRRNNKRVGLTTRDSKLLLYGDICKLGNQVERLLKLVERSKVKFILLDDIKKDTLNIYKEILDFLEVDYDEKIDFHVANTGKVRKSKILALIVKMLGYFKQRLKITKGFGILNKTNRTNKKDYKRKSLDEEFKNELESFFENDIKKLGSLINRDLQMWLH
jgi:hypothetical protein